MTAFQVKQTQQIRAPKVKEVSVAVSPKKKHHDKPKESSKSRYDPRVDLGLDGSSVPQKSKKSSTGKKHNREDLQPEKAK